jgi:arginine repressor
MISALSQDGAFSFIPTGSLVMLNLQYNIYMITKEQLTELYINQNLSKKEIVEKLHVTNWTLSKSIKEYNLRKSPEQIEQCRVNYNLKKYGTSNPSKSVEIKNKIIESNIKKYGAHSFTATNVGKQKVADTKLERYGDSNYNNIDKNRRTKTERYGDPYFSNRAKCKETLQQKYGVDNAFQLIKKEDNINNLILNKGYSDLVKELYLSKEKSIEYVKGKNYSYFDLSNLLNIPYYTVQQWVKRFSLESYINYTFDGKSHYEDEIIKEILKIKNVKIERNVKILGGQEIDIYLPDYKLGIEFNGDYWHSDLFKDKKYHQQKSISAEKHGIHLIHIWQYEWNNPHIKRLLITMLKLFMGEINQRIYARKCEIRILSNAEAKPFNEANHLQGHRNAQVTYGLFYNGELVQLMSFSRTRYNKNLKNENDWEIIRGCPGSLNLVIGGVSKLFARFIKDYNPHSVFSYCDFNKFTGVSYEKLGMRFIGLTSPDMHYWVKGEVLNRSPSLYKERKDRVEARLYGAGSKKYVWESA